MHSGWDHNTCIVPSKNSHLKINAEQFRNLKNTETEDICVSSSQYGPVRKGGGRARVCRQPRRPRAPPGAARACRLHPPRPPRRGRRRAWPRTARGAEPPSASARSSLVRRGSRRTRPVAAPGHRFARLEGRGGWRRDRGRRCRGRGWAAPPWSRTRGRAGAEQGDKRLLGATW